jgi:hypothetical protein
LQRSQAPSQGSPQQTPSTQFPFWQLAPVVQVVPTPPSWSMHVEPSCAQRRAVGSPQSCAQQRDWPSTALSQLPVWHSTPLAHVCPVSLRHWPATRT